MGSKLSAPAPAATPAGAPPAAAAEPPPSKVGAGLLICCRGEVLLLCRNSRNNHGTWGLPGGNVDEGDASLEAAALREAHEELPGLPDCLPGGGLRIVGSVLTRRGKRRDKHYTVFVAALSPEARAAWRIQLNEEHSAARWVPLPEARARRDLHPVAALCLQEHWEAVQAALALSEAGGGPGAPTP